MKVFRCVARSLFNLLILWLGIQALGSMVFGCYSLAHADYLGAVASLVSLLITGGLSWQLWRWAGYGRASLEKA